MHRWAGMASELQSFSSILGANKNTDKEKSVTGSAPPPLAASQSRRTDARARFVVIVAAFVGLALLAIFAYIMT
jgi:hypothetical protein